MTPPQASARDAYGRTLVELGKKHSQLVVMDADLSPSTMTRYFASEFPRRFFDCGIAEQNMMSIAAGMASCGKTVFVSTFAIFASTRAFDQIRLGIAQPGLDVKIVATHSGISVGQDGLSHHAIEDLALMGSFPSFTVVVP
ncbi:MAG: transketolase family protein, partial [Chloroflexota bacterium]